MFLSILCFLPDNSLMDERVKKKAFVWCNDNMSIAFVMMRYIKKLCKLLLEYRDKIHFPRLLYFVSSQHIVWSPNDNYLKPGKCLDYHGYVIM